MRTINVKANSKVNEILEQIASTLENDILDDENLKGSFSCEINDEKITQYELDSEGEIFNEVVWYVDTVINESGLGSTVNIDC